MEEMTAEERALAVKRLAEQLAAGGRKDLRGADSEAVQADEAGDGDGGGDEGPADVRGGGGEGAGEDGRFVDGQFDNGQCTI